MSPAFVVETQGLRRWIQQGVLTLATAACLFTLPAGAQESPVPSRPAQGAASPLAQQLKKFSLEDLLQVEVTTVSRMQATVGRSAAAVHVISPEDIRRSGATSIPELLRAVPGMDVARIDGNKWAISARGFNERFGRNLLVQVDGRVVYNPLFSGVYWDTVDYPLEDIERIEVIRGPGASVWGANAVNGIVNIFTRSATDTQGLLASGGGGIEEQAFGTLRYGGRINGAHAYRLYGKAFRRGAQFSSVGDAHDRWQGSSGGMSLDWRASDEDSLRLQADILSSEAERKDLRATLVSPFVLTNFETEITHAANVLARWTHRFDDGSRWTLQAYWDHVGRESDNGFLDVRWDTIDVDFQHEFMPGDRHRFIYGLAYRDLKALFNPSRDGGFALSFPPPRRHPRLFSAFVEDQIRLVDVRLTFILGSKFEHNDFTGFEWQPTARLLWTPTDRHSAWAAASRAIRMPSLSEDGTANTLPPSQPGIAVFSRRVSNPDLESEVVVAYELGYRAQTTDNLSVDVAFFYNDHDRLSVTVPGSPTPPPPPIIIPLRFQNRMKANTYGVEVSIAWQPTATWRLRGAYTFLEMRLQADGALSAATRTTAEAAEGQSPEHQLYLQSSWNLPRNVELDLIGRFVERLPGFVPAVPGYVAADVRVSWTVHGNVELSVVGQNLFDAHHAEIGTSAVVRSLPVEIERAIYGKITWRH